LRGRDCSEMDRLLRTSQADSSAEDHAKDQVILADDAVIDIVRAEQVSDYKLKLCFSDGTERVIDFEPFLRASRNPMIRAYLEPSRFGNFRVECGDLIWDDYGLCFPIADLYENRV
jgi:hypothetical protein